MLLKLINKILFKLRHVILLNKYQKKKFKKYQDLENFCHKKNDNNWSNQSLNSFRLESFKSNFDQIHLNSQPAFGLLIEAVSIYLTHFKKFPKILDIGGVYGDGYLYLRNLFKDSDINYSVIETDKVVELSKKINFKNKINQEINFYQNLDEALNKNEFDLIFSSGTLQYLKNPYELLEKLNQSNTKLIALTRNAFNLEEEMIAEVIYPYGDGKEIYFTKNFNKSIILYPHKSLLEKKLIKILNKYNIILCKNFYEIVHLKNNYSKDYIFKIKN